MGVAAHDADDDSFKTPQWRDPLARYARRLRQTLSSDLSALSGTGLPLDASKRMTLTVQSYHGPGATGTLSKAAAASIDPTPMSEADCLEDWYYTNSACPLLVLAPFGCGKSALLAFLACELAEGLERWCEEPEGELPRVPLPIRLRGWVRDQTLEAYVESGAQRDVLSAGRRDWLPADQVRLLLDAGRLLPLLDGLDELPETLKRDGITTRPRYEALSDVWRLFPDHHVLTARPGHGAEGGGYAHRGGILTLGEPTQRDARDFAFRRLGLVEDRFQHPLRLRFDADDRSTGGLIRRPLFLTAWCDRVARQPDASPATAAALMDTVLDHLLDHRLSDHHPVEHDELKASLLDQRHRLGAVLALHAERGFGVPLDEPAKAAPEKQHARALPPGTARGMYRQALKAGLLSRCDAGTYVSKIAVVEYLIGRYYAWLADQGDQGLMVLAGLFGRTVVSPAFAETWGHAFDAMWDGSAAQHTAAAELVAWLLNWSAACTDAASEAVTRSQQESSDALALRLLPPSGLPSTKDTQRLAGPLIDPAFNLWQARQANRWQLTKQWEPLPPRGQESAFDPLLRRHPRQFIEWILERLEDLQYQGIWRVLTAALGRSWTLLADADVDRLVRIARDDARNPAWCSSALSLYRVARRMEGIDRDTVRRALRNGENTQSPSVRDMMLGSSSHSAAQERIARAAAVHGNPAVPLPVRFAPGTLQRLLMPDTPALDREPAAGAEPESAAGPNRRPDLEPRQWAALRYVHRCQSEEGEAPTQQMIARRIAIGEDSAYKDCCRLENELKLIHRPYGPRKGYRLTARGMALMTRPPDGSSRPG